MKFRMLLLTLVLGIMVTGCNEQPATDESKIEISDVTEENVSSDEQTDSEVENDEEPIAGIYFSEGYGEEEVVDDED